MKTTRCTVPVKITDHRFVNRFTTQIERNGEASSWIFASRKKAPGIIGKVADAAVVVAVLHAKGEPLLVLTREFRAPLGTYELSLPSGLIDEGEDTAAAAKREFHEETGLTLTEISHISPPLASSAGLTDETVSLVYGKASGVVSREFQTLHEDIEIRLVTISQIQDLIRHPTDVISSRLYPILIGFISSGKILIP